MRFFRRNKLTPDERAAQIKAKYETKMAGQGMFTPAQEKLREELGLKPGANPVKKSKNSKEVKKIKDPLSSRQRKLMEELGLVNKDDKRFE
jgi:hypothetical protein